MNAKIDRFAVARCRRYRQSCRMLLRRTNVGSWLKISRK